MNDKYNEIKKLKKYIWLMIVLLSVSVIILFFAFRSPFVSVYTLEAGEELKAENLLRKPGQAQFVSPLDESIVNKVGQHTVQVKHEEKTYKVKVRVVDTTLPEVSVKNVSLYVGQSIEADAFVQSIADHTQVNVTLDSKVDTFVTGEYNVTVKFEDEGHNSVVKQATLSVLKDEEAPVIKVLSDIYVTKGESISYRRYFEVLDNCDGMIQDYNIDSSKVNMTKKGTYDLTINAKDKAGNQSSKMVNVYVVDYDINKIKTELDQYAKQILDRIIKPSMTTKQKLKAVYDYVIDSYSYQGYHQGDIDNYFYDAYYGFKNRRGDCYVANGMARYLLESLHIPTYGYVVKGKSDMHIFYVAYNGDDYYYYSALKRGNGTRIYEWSASEVLAYLRKWDGVTKLPELKLN